MLYAYIITERLLLISGIVDTFTVMHVFYGSRKVLDVVVGGGSHRQIQTKNEYGAGHQVCCRRFKGEYLRHEHIGYQKTEKCV